MPMTKTSFFTRLVDNEKTDPALLNQEVSFFINAIEELYVHGKCLECFGYTSLMLKTLSKPIVWTVKGKLRSIGFSRGVPDDIKERCLKRMGCWVVLAKAVARAEFPSFEIVNALSVFNLSNPKSLDHKTKIERIAKAIGKPVSSLEMQFDDVYPRAKSLAGISNKDSPDANKDGWRIAVERLNSTKTLKACHPTDVLKDALVLYKLFGPSSSGVEQSFSKASWAMGSRRRHACETFEEMNIKCVLDLKHYDKNHVIYLAQKVWATCLKPPRASPTQPRIDTGIKRPRCEAASEIDADGFVVHTEKEFISKRRRAIASECDNSTSKSVNNNDDEVVDVDSQAWTDTHSKELAFQQNKLASRKIQAVAEGTLLDRETSAALEESSKQAKMRRLKDQRARVKKAVADVKKIRGMRGEVLWAQLQGQNVCIDRTVPESDHDTIQAALRSNDMTVVSDIVEATVFVVDISKQECISQRVNLWSSMSGAFHVSPELVTSSGAKGCALKLHAAVQSSQTLYVSPQCLAHHSSLWVFLSAAAARLPRSKLVVHVHDDPDVDTLSKVKASTRNNNFTAVVRGSEESDAASPLDQTPKHDVCRINKLHLNQLIDSIHFKHFETILP